MSMQKSFAAMVQRSIETREENTRLRDRILELEKQIQERDMRWENAIRQTGYEIPPHSQSEFIDACRKCVQIEA